MSPECLPDSEAVIACVRNIACGADAHDWDLVKDCFDANVRVDYVTLAGGAPVQLSPEQIVEAWQGLLPGFAFTRHRLSNFRVERTGDQARCRCYVDALHVIPDARGGDAWQVVGAYDFRLVRRSAGWKVSEMRFEKDYLTGNQALPELAQARLHPRRLEVEIPCNRSILPGHLYLPGDWDDNGALSAVLVCGSWLSLKEQMAGAYARAMARMGFAALAFDHRGFGSVADDPLQTEWPERKIADCMAAAAFLQSRPELDFERIFGLGLGAGAGYMLWTAAEDTRLRALALVGGWLQEPAAQAEIYGGEEPLGLLRQQGLDAQHAYDTQGVTTCVSVSSISGAYSCNAAMAAELAWLGQSGTSWKDEISLHSWNKWLPFEPLARTGEVRLPTLIIHSPQSFYPQGAEACFQQLGGPKSLYWVRGTQSDFYASPTLRTSCIRRIADYFRSCSG